jgi:hypothetical protein
MAASEGMQRKVRMLESYSPRSNIAESEYKPLNQSSCGKLYIHLCNYTNIQYTINI